MGIKIDLTQSRTLPDAVYPIMITDCDRKDPEDWIPDSEDPTSGEPGASGKWPYLMWELTIKEGEKAGEAIMHITTLKPSALFGLKAICRAAGYQWPDADASDNFEFDPKDLFGTELLAELTTQEYPPGSGDKRNAVKKFHSIEEQAELEEKQERGAARGSRSRGRDTD